MSTDAGIWNAGEEACIVVRVNGNEEKVSKGTISNLGAYISAKAHANGISKFQVKVNGEKVSPAGIRAYNIDDVEHIDIDVFDIVRRISIYCRVQ